ncbi:hypothetical protein [Sulfurimonas sp.]
MDLKQVDDATSIINQSLKTLNGVSSKKINFRNSNIDENFYAVVFDIDKSSMQNGNDFMNALSLLEDKVLGIHSCMENEDSISVISGTEDESGLILKTHITAYIYATYEDINSSLSAFTNHLKLLALDVETLLGINIGNDSKELNILQELSDKVKGLSLDLIYQEADIAISSIETDTLAYAQLQRFLDIAGLIDEKDTSKLIGFFTKLCNGEVYTAPKNIDINEKLIESLTNIFSELNVSSDSLLSLADNVTEMTPNTLRQELREKSNKINSINKELGNILWQ